MPDSVDEFWATNLMDLVAAGRVIDRCLTTFAARDSMLSVANFRRSWSLHSVCVATVVLAACTENVPEGQDGGEEAGMSSGTGATMGATASSGGSWTSDGTSGVEVSGGSGDSDSTAVGTGPVETGDSAADDNSGSAELGTSGDDETEDTEAGDSGGDERPVCRVPNFRTHSFRYNCLDCAGLVPVDLDGDGDLDLAGVARAHGQFFWLEQTQSAAAGNGPGNRGHQSRLTWDGHRISRVADTPVALHAGDFDGDGRPDLVVVLDKYPLRTVTVWRNESTVDNPGAWSPYLVIEAFGAGERPEPADLDGDGLLDLVSHSTWFRNPGSLTEPFDSIPLGDGWRPFNPSAFEILDFDRDGDLDVIGRDINRTDLFWNENLTGDASSWAEHPITQTSRSARVTYGDINLDGLDDVVVFEFPTMELFETQQAADGTLSFVESEFEGVGGSEHSRIVNFDGDEFPDILHGDYSSKVRWHQNYHGNHGQEWRDYEIHSYVTHQLSAVDLDGDGDTDIVGVAGPSKLVWWENNCDEDADL